MSSRDTRNDDEATCIETSAWRDGNVRCQQVCPTDVGHKATKEETAKGASIIVTVALFVLYGAIGIANTILFGSAESVHWLDEYGDEETASALYQSVGDLKVSNASILFLCIPTCIILLYRGFKKHTRSYKYSGVMLTGVLILAIIIAIMVSSETFSPDGLYQVVVLTNVLSCLSFLTLTIGLIMRRIRKK